MLLLFNASGPIPAQEYVNQKVARRLLQLPAHERGEAIAITDIEFSPDGKLIAIGSADGLVRTLSTAEGSLPEIVSKGKNHVLKTAFSPDGKLLASADFLTAKIRSLDPDDEKLERDLDGSSCVAFSPDGKLIAVGNYLDGGTVVDLSTRKPRFSMAPFAGTGPVDTGLYKPSTVNMDFSSDGKLLAVTTDFFDDELPGFQHVQVWETDSGKLRFFFRGKSCGFSPDGDLLAYQSQLYEGDHRIVLLNIKTFLPDGVLTGQYQDARFAPDGHSVAAISNQGVELWSITSMDGQPRSCNRDKVLRHASEVTSLAFAPDGNSLATGDKQGAIRLWQLGK